jgi:hypothetical protein
LKAVVSAIWIAGRPLAKTAEASFSTKLHDIITSSRLGINITAGDFQYIQHAGPTDHTFVSKAA